MKLNKKLKDLCYRQLFPKAGLLLIKFISSTYRYRVVGTEYEKRAIEAHGTVIYASWHQRMFPGFTFFNTRQPIAIMISQSADGDERRQCSDSEAEHDPGTLERWNIDPSRLDPRLVTVRISVFGQDGPKSLRPGLDRNGVAYGGLLHLTVEPDRPPVDVRHRLNRRSGPRSPGMRAPTFR